MNPHSGVLLNFPQISSLHCSLSLSRVEGALATLTDSSTNGSWINSSKVQQRVPTPVVDGDLLCLSVAEESAPNCVSFRLHRYDAERWGAPAASPQGTKRARLSEPALASGLHASNEALRAELSKSAEALGAAKATLASESARLMAQLESAAAVAAEAKRAALQQAEQFTQELAAARAAQDKAASEATAAVAATKARCTSLEAEVTEAQREARMARELRNAAEACVLEHKTASDASRASLEAQIEQLRERLRSEREEQQALRDEAAQREAALAAAKQEAAAEGLKAQRQAEETHAAQAATKTERELRAEAQRAAAAAEEEAQGAQLQLQRLVEETRGVRERAAIDAAVLQRLAAAAVATHAAAAELLPHIHALQQRHGAAAVPPLNSLSAADAGTQVVRHSLGAAPAAQQPGNQTQHMDIGEGQEEAPQRTPMLSGREDAAAADDFCGTFPSASVQAAMEEEHQKMLAEQAEQQQ